MDRVGNPDLTLYKALRKLGLSLDKGKIESLITYCLLLLEGLSRQRLTGESSLEDLINRQLCDCLFPIKKIAFKKGQRIVDLGSGGGLPGIPLAICLPECQLYLLDANKKKAAFLEETALSLGLKNVIVLRQRAEAYGQDPAYREKYEYVVSKAVAKAAALAELALPLLALGGNAIFYKGPRGEQEMSEAERAIKVCGGKINNCYQYTLPNGEKRAIYLVKKIELTPAQYPRSAGRPARRPIK